MTSLNATSASPSPIWQRWLMALGPLVVLIAIVALFLSSDPLSVFTGDVPPIEELQTQRVVLNSDGITIHLINNGPDPVTIAQVLVDDAYWHFEITDGDQKINRLERATLEIPYPWVEGEAHEVVILSSTGVTFPVEIAVALETPEATSKQFTAYGLLGIYVGIVPVALGLLWYPFLRTIGSRWMNFVLALTVGMLVFLAVDTILEALEVATEVPGTFQGGPLVYLVTLLSFLAIVAVGHNRKRPDSRLFLAYMIALGIGFHNLGEGLAVGTAFALGEASLGTFLVVGFTLHNITEGIGIAAPIAKERPKLIHFVLLTLLAGAPAIIGTWLGGFAFDPLLAVIFLSIGAGAILQVVYEVTRLILRSAERENQPALSWLNLGGLTTGIAIMYFTAFLVA
ncbi:MAG: ZIP family metal transporter [Anaerolineae bacterium]|nr:ZIP family metal transporter [Anaerolineae bacterium]